jgi:hypothetical protein
LISGEGSFFANKINGVNLVITVATVAIVIEAIR